MLERVFALSRHGSSVRTEVLGGVTTFVTMAYIIVVNPAILHFAGIPVGPSAVATALAAALGCFLMGLYANRPIAVAPYMGENAFIAFGLAGLGAAWPQALGAVFVSGALLAAITVLGLRSWLAGALSPSLKHGFAVGIGLFLTLIGLYQAGIVTSFVTGMPAAALEGPGGLLRAPDAPLKIGDLRDTRALLAVGGVILIVALMQRRVRGAILVGIAATALAGASLGLGESPHAFVALPFVGDYSLAPIAGKLDLAGVFRIGMLPFLLTLFLMALLDTLGSLVGLGAAAGLLDEKGDLPEIEKPMLVDAASCMIAGVLGTTTSGAYIESAAGIREGARTGLAAVTTGMLFLASLFFLPLLEPLQHLEYAYAPALVAVGLLMVGSIRKIEVDDMTELVPAFATIAMMVFTYNIANGLTAALVLHPVLKVLAGRAREIRSGGVVLAVLCSLYYLFGLPH
jgi:adenine/guanine/hypoxanthine permease